MSTIDNPNDFNQDANGLSWTANDQAAGYEVYEVESSNTSASKRALLKTVGKLKGQIDSLSPVGYTSEKTYLISVVDSYGNQAAPVKNTYSGVAPYEPNGNQPLTPEQEALVQDPTNKMVVAGYYFTLVVDEEGSLWSFGHNQFGQLGHPHSDGSNYSNYTPTKIMTEVKSVAGGGYHTLVIKKNGDLFSFGNNQYGQLGHPDNSGTSNTNPTPTKIMTEVKSVTAGYHHSLVIKENGELLSFGRNNYGQLGYSTNSGNSNPNYSPRIVRTGVKSGAAGDNHSLLIKENGDLYSFGKNTTGQLGDNYYNNIPNYTPRLIMSDAKLTSAGGNHTLAIKENGDLFSFGYNFSGELGHSTNSGTRQPNPSPTQIMTDVKLVATHTEHSLALREDGSLYSFGKNWYGQLGHSANTQSSNPNPTPAKVLENVQSVTTGNVHTVVVKENGDLFGFGQNSSGQLAQNASNPNLYFIPKQIHLPTE